MKRGLMVFAGALFVAVLGVSMFCSLWTSAGRPQTRRTITVARETLPVTITETGLLEPKAYEIVTAPVSGELVELIKEGAEVREGDVVARLNDDEAREELEMEKIAIKTIQAKLRKAQLDSELTEKDLTFERRKAQIELDLAKLDLAELERKPMALVLALGGVDEAYWKAATETVTQLARLDVEYAALAEQTALKRYERQKKLAKQGVASENDVGDARLKYERERAVHENAQIILELIRKGVPKGDIQIAQEKVKQAEVKLMQIEQSARAQVDLKKAEAAVAQAELNRKQESLDIHRAILQSTVVKSPAAGTVLYWGQWGRPHEGDRIWRGNGFLSITQLGRMIVRTHVNEVDCRRIGVGQKVIVRVEALPDKVYHGKVTWIAGLATDRDERQQGVLRKDLSNIMVFEVMLEIEECDKQLLPTMSATVEIIVEELKDVIAVPFSALIERDGRAFVRVLENGRATEREVKTGRSIRSKVVVTEGLKDGDVVCLM
ncbi:MAG: HlyD family efflux transporter periplasmic adaptor subunit [Planctomycetes bacterium]|nr:HlyD family efflux transporter periplasmic adaptor subunit [Planctomycetota bacterium]